MLLKFQHYDRDSLEANDVVGVYAVKKFKF
jgi:hypothetical protein